MTAAEIVLDASALLRGLLGESREAEEIVGGVWDGDVQAHAPDLIGPGYDAFYAVLSEMLELPLVTADRKLAAAVEGSVLVV